MMMSIYATLGIFLLFSVRNPSEHRSLIRFAAWSSFAHAVVMSALAMPEKYAEESVGFLVGSALLVVIGITLLILVPPRGLTERMSDDPSR